MDFKPLPVGIDDFRKLIQGNYYYVDKTLLIKELLDMKGEVNLFTRPRRFGKTLNISMLQYFFENTPEKNEELFTGMKIMEAGEKYLKHMGQYPVLNFSFKSMKQRSFSDAFYCLKEEISREYRRHDRIIKGLSYESERSRYLRMIEMEASEEEYLTSIKFLSECLYRYYGRKVIILIDEYDVPLENAYFSGFYERMTTVIRSLFESALKTNSCLEFAVVTGCLRISRESIFTGLNNLEIISITSDYYSEHFGFTRPELRMLLEYYEICEKADVIQEWYDGYLFGETKVYNPWSVVNYVKACIKNSSAFPAPYWSNTSSNSIVRRLVEQADFSVKQEIESLIEGKTIVKPIYEDITYEDMETTQDNLWNFLFFTGYLKKINEVQKDGLRYIELAIPNNEVRYIYKNTVLRWFDMQVGKKNLSSFYKAVLEGNSQEMEQVISENLMETISFYDYQESFYHGFLAGLLKNIGNYIVLSNRESGDGRPDLLLKYPSVRGKAVIMEFKVAKTYEEMEEKCREALEQIEDRKYEAALRHEGYRDIMKYGISFYRKDCMVRQGE